MPAHGAAKVGSDAPSPALVLLVAVAVSGFSSSSSGGSGVVIDKVLVLVGIQVSEAEPRRHPLDGLPCGEDDRRAGFLSLGRAVTKSGHGFAE